MKSENSHTDQLGFWDHWHETRAPKGWSDADALLVKAFLESLGDLGETHPVLDLGCGQCTSSLYLTRAIHDIVAVDFSSAALRRAALRDLEPTRVQLVQHDITTRLPFPEGQFAGVFAHLSLHYFDSATTNAILAEVSRVVCPGGAVAISVKSTSDRYYGEGLEIGQHMFLRKGHLRRFFTEETLRAALASWHIASLWETTDYDPGASVPSSLWCAVASKQNTQAS